MDIDAFKAKYAGKLAAARKQLATEARIRRELNIGGRPEGILSSRVGGPIAWPSAEPIPQDHTDQPMILAAQINFGEMQGLGGFPSSGLLQLFLANDVNARGITFFREHRSGGDYPLRNGDGFRLVFHSETGDLVETLYQPPDVDYPIWSSDFITHPLAVTAGDAVDQFPPMTHWQGSAAYEEFERLPEAADDLVELYDLLNAEVWDEQIATAFYLGGYACPLQSDHRRFFEEFRRYDTCVLNFGELPGLELPDMNLAILISESDLQEARFEDTIMIADTD